jgi:mono/diheme cytochrome c family protein
MAKARATVIRAIRVARRLTPRFLAFGLAAVCCQLLSLQVAHAQSAPGTNDKVDSAVLALGQRIYRDGTGASGQPLKAVGAAQTTLAAKDVACANCHRRSGYGSAEGRLFVRPITGPALRREYGIEVHSVRGRARIGVSPRPPYNDEYLAKAIRTGIDSSGKTLDSAMPRYALTDAEMKALTAYLFSLSLQPAPGVDDEDVHLATVIQPDIAPERRRAMLEVMQAFVKDKSGSSRHEEQRREAGNMRKARSFRKWVLHVWELTRPSETWAAQLDAFYKERPVFALVGGLGNASWRPIHEFCERNEIPSVFPLVDLPVVTGTNNYNIYFSRGVTLDAEVIAKFLRQQGRTGRVIQVYRADDEGTAAAAAFRASIAANDGLTLEDKVLEATPTTSFWDQLYATNPSALVLWLGAQDLNAARPSEGSIAPAIFVSFNLLKGRLPTAKLAAQGLRLVYPSDLPPRRDARLSRSKLWLHNKGIPLTDETLQINAQYAMAVASDSLGHIMDTFSRDYFVERLEHVVTQSPMPSIYQTVSLGPGQRFAAKGSYIVLVTDDTKNQLKAMSGWIVP